MLHRSHFPSHLLNILPLFATYFFFRQKKTLHFFQEFFFSQVDRKQERKRGCGQNLENVKKGDHQEKNELDKKRCIKCVCVDLVYIRRSVSLLVRPSLPCHPVWISSIRYSTSFSLLPSVPLHRCVPLRWWNIAHIICHYVPLFYIALKCCILFFAKRVRKSTKIFFLEIF